jgi:hypothetical protein
VKVLVGLVLELFNVLLGEAQDREDEMSNEVGKMRLKVCPHLLGSYRLVEEDQSVRKARSAEPRGFGDPFLNLLEVVLEDLGGDVRGEVLGESKCFFALTRTGRVTVSNKESVQVEESPLLGLPPVMLLAFVLVALHGVGGAGLGDGV